MTLPPHVRAEVQSILDGAARRLLEERDTQPVSTPAGMNSDGLNNSPDKGTTFLKGESRPIITSDGEGGKVAA